VRRNNSILLTIPDFKMADKVGREDVPRNRVLMGDRNISRQLLSRRNMLRAFSYPVATYGDMFGVAGCSSNIINFIRSLGKWEKKCFNGANKTLHDLFSIYWFKLSS